MKILYCKNCGDLYNLTGHTEKACGCGRTSGILEDEVGQFRGDPFLITVTDQSFSEALLKQIQLNKNEPQPILTTLLPRESHLFKPFEE